MCDMPCAVTCAFRAPCMHQLMLARCRQEADQGNRQKAHLQHQHLQHHAVDAADARYGQDHARYRQEWGEQVSGDQVRSQARGSREPPVSLPLLSVAGALKSNVQQDVAGPEAGREGCSSSLSKDAHVAPTPATSNMAALQARCPPPRVRERFPVVSCGVRWARAALRSLSSRFYLHTCLRGHIPHRTADLARATQREGVGAATGGQDVGKSHPAALRTGSGG